ncbi:hypothetical protein [Arthrobacter sp. NPDC056727]|uniref:hypothetical protein n=1 Tax=Arthrobacter sp. NPDC056727 TaxID=3345927 RepID=UPI00366F9CFE
MKNHRLTAERPEPTLDEAHLRCLAGECSPAAAESFADNYKALLPRRVERIILSIGAVMAREIGLHLPELQEALAGRRRLVR